MTIWLMINSIDKRYIYNVLVNIMKVFYFQKINEHLKQSAHEKVT